MKSIIEKARHEFETQTVDYELLARLYQEYNPVPGIKNFIERSKRTFPEGNCGLASLYLKYRLGGRVVRGSYGPEQHTFLLLDDTVIDITADQFGGPKVYIGPLKAPYQISSSNLNS